MKRQSLCLCTKCGKRIGLRATDAVMVVHPTVVVALTGCEPVNYYHARCAPEVS